MKSKLSPQKDLRTMKAYTHGGINFNKRRKIARPLVAGKVTHVVFKSSKAKGDLSFYKHKKLITSLLKEKSQKFSIEILDWVNMGNHLHLQVRFKNRENMGKFLKSFSSLLARKITQAKKGQKFGKFWDGLVYTRVLMNKTEELSLKIYFEGPHRERELSLAQSELYLKRFNQFIYRLRQRKAVSAKIMNP